MPAPLTYRFADLTLDVGRRRVERGAEPIELGKLTYGLLVALVEAAPNVLTHDELVRRVWGGRSTSHETVTQRVKLLRDALEDDADQPRYIGLVRGQGYRLIAPVQTVQPRNAMPKTAPLGSRRPRIAVAAGAGLFLLSIGAVSYLWLGNGTLSDSAAAPPGPLDFEITQVTTSGRAISPAISPDGRYIVYSLMDAASVPTSLWVRQIGATRDIEVVAPSPETAVVSAAFSPDGSFIDYLKISAAGREHWRVPFLGGTPRRLRSAVASAVGWSPDGKEGAFIAYDDVGNTLLVARDTEGAERILATRTVPSYFVSVNIVGNPPLHPAWSPDGRVIALAETTDILAPRIAFVDVRTGEDTTVASQGSFVTQGVGWLGPSTLVLSQPARFGQRIQLHRMSYPSGAVTPLTNDLSSYLGVELDASRSRLATTRRDMRSAVYVADAMGNDAVEVVPPTPIGITRVLLSWAGDRLLYDSTSNGRAMVAAITADGVNHEEVVPDAFHVAAAPDGSAIVFSHAARGREGLWRTDAAGLDPVQLVSGFAVEPVVTRTRQVVYVANDSGFQSPWIVPLDGGQATEIIRETAEGVDVSPDGRRLAFPTARDRTWLFVTCDLPHCSSRRELPAPPNYGFSLRWTPDGQALAYVDTSWRAIWAAPLDGGAPHAIATYSADTSPIAWFAWSADGQRLAFIRLAMEFDIVLLSGLRP